MTDSRRRPRGRARQARPGPRPTSTCPLDGATITDDGRIRASVPTIEALADGRRPGGRGAPTSAGPRARPTRRTRWRPVAARLGELLGRPVAFATDTVGESAQADGRRPRATARSRSSRTSASTPGETSKDDAGAARSPTSWPRWPTPSSTTASASCTASRPACTTSRSGCRTRWAAWSRAEVDVLRRLTDDPERPYVVVLGGSKVSDKLGVIDNLLGKADKLLIGGGMVFTFLEAQGHEVGKSLLEADQLDTCRGYLSAAEESGVRDPAADRHRRRHRRSRRRPRRRSRASCRPTQIPADALGLDIGPESGAAFADGDPGGRAHRLLERPDGRVRGPRLRRRHPCRRRRRSTEVDGLSVVGGGDSRGRRPQLGFDEAASATSPPAAAPVARVPRGQGAARASPSSRGLTPNGRMTAHAADGGQLEDEPQPPGSGRAGAEARLDAVGQEARLRQGRGRRCSRRSPTSARCRRWSTATGSRSATARRTSPSTTAGAYTGEISAAMLAKLGCSYVVVGHSERREYHDGDRRAGQRQGPQGARGRDDPDRVRAARASRSARPASHVRVHAGAGRRLAGRLHRRAGRRRWSSPTSRSGRSAPARSPPPTTRRRSARRSAARIARGARRRRRRRRPDPVRRLGQGRQRRRDHGARPTSTGASSAAPACRPTSSAASAGSTTCRVL